MIFRKYPANTIPKDIPIVFFVLWVKVDKNKQIVNITTDEKSGVILKSINAIRSNSPLRLKPIKLNTPTHRIISEI